MDTGAQELHLPRLGKASGNHLKGIGRRRGTLVCLQALGLIWADEMQLDSLTDDEGKDRLSGCRGIAIAQCAPQWSYPRKQVRFASTFVSRTKKSQVKETRQPR